MTQTYTPAQWAAAGGTLSSAQQSSLSEGAAAQASVNANNAAGTASAIAGETGLSPERVAQLQAENAGGDVSIAITNGNKWVDPATGQETPPGVGMPKAPTSGTPPPGAALISDPGELSKFKETDIWRDPKSNNIYDIRNSKATLTSPTGERKVVMVGSQEANRLLKTGYTLGDKVGGGTITSTTLTDENGIVTADGATPGSFESDAVVAGANATSTAMDDKIKRNYEMLAGQEETDLSKKVTQLLGEAEDLAGDLTGRGAAQLEEERKRQIEEKTNALARKNTELKAKLAEVNALTASYNQANQVEEGRPQTLSRLQGAQAQNYKMYLAQKNSLAADAGILQAELLGMQGELNAAQAAADRAIDLEYMDRESAYNAKIAQLNLLQPQLEKEEARYAQAVSLTLQQEANALAEQKQFKKDIQDAKWKAISLGIEDADLLTQIGNARSLDEAQQLIGTNIPAPVIRGTGTGPGTTPTEQVNVPTFEEYLAQSEEAALRSFSGVERDQLKDEYNQLVTQTQQVSYEQLSPIAKSVWDGTLTLQDLTPTQKANIGPELNQAGWTKVVANEQKADFSTTKTGIDDVLAKWNKVPNGYKGVLQGRVSNLLKAGEWNQDVAEFNASRGIVGMQLTRLFEKGRISDADREFYMNLMPNLRMNEDAANAGAKVLKERLDTKLEANIGEVNQFISESGSGNGSEGLTDEEAYQEYLSITN